mmetsp:Transcript_30249/g.87184  ORF Transcript_30249/g.87184 Transcript_30249/m.87184 type:complete len:239 (+) Transcript_30249:1206-1922(+)
MLAVLELALRLADHGLDRCDRLGKLRRGTASPSQRRPQPALGGAGGHARRSSDRRRLAEGPAGVPRAAAVGRGLVGGGAEVRGRQLLDLPLHLLGALFQVLVLEAETLELLLRLALPLRILVAQLGKLLLQARVVALQLGVFSLVPLEFLGHLALLGSDHRHLRVHATSHCHLLLHLVSVHLEFGIRALECVADLFDHLKRLAFQLLAERRDFSFQASVGRLQARRFRAARRRRRRSR